MSVIPLLLIMLQISLAGHWPAARAEAAIDTRHREIDEEYGRVRPNRALPSSGPLEGGPRRSEGAAAAPQVDAAWPSFKVTRLVKGLQLLVGGDIWKGA